MVLCVSNRPRAEEGGGRDLRRPARQLSAGSAGAQWEGVRPVCCVANPARPCSGCGLFERGRRASARRLYWFQPDCVCLRPRVRGCALQLGVFLCCGRESGMTSRTLGRRAAPSPCVPGRGEGEAPRHTGGPRSLPQGPTVW